MSRVMQGKHYARSPQTQTYAFAHLAPKKHYQCFSLRAARPFTQGSQVYGKFYILKAAARELAAAILIMPQFCTLHFAFCIYFAPIHLTSTAFCACNLFSASSKISFACASNTSLVISSSLCAGKQWSTIAFSLATFITSALIW